MHDALDNVIANLARFEGSAIVGALDPVNAQKLAWSEFGNKAGVPPRPTLSVTTDRLTPAIDRSIKRQVGEAIDGKGRGVTGQEIVGGIARDLAEEVRNAIDGNTAPALAPSTAASRRRRGKDTRTLVDEGDMLKSIDVRTSADPKAFADDE